MIRSVSAISIILACSLLTAQAQVNPGNNVASPNGNANMASIFQNMINYFNEHPFTDASGKPSQAFQSMIQQMQSADSSTAKPAANSAPENPTAANVALPAHPATAADVVLPAAPPTANPNVAVKNAPADIPIALAAGVPASVAAAAAIPKNQATNPSPAVISAEPVAIHNPSVSAAAIPPVAEPVVPQAPVVPPAPNVVPAPSAAVSVSSAAVEPPYVAPVNPSVEAASIVPVSTIFASESSAVPPPVHTLTSASPVPTTGAMSRTNAMSNASLSATRSMSNSASASRSASPTATSTIPPISASNSLHQSQSVALPMALSLAVVIITILSFF